MICFRGTLFVPFLEDLGEGRLTVCLGDLDIWLLFDTEKFFAAVFDCICAILEALNLGLVAKLPNTATILIVVDVLVGVDGPDHFLLVGLFKRVISGWVERQLVSLRSRESRTKVVLPSPVCTQQIHEVQLFLGPN